MKYSANSKGRKYILPRSRILRGREPIQRLFRKGRVLRERHVDLRYLSFPGQPGLCMMGFIVGKRMGKAHERNLIKRRMREAYRQHQYLIRDITQSGEIGFQGIFIAKKSAISFQIIEQECVRLLNASAQRLREQSQS